MNVQDLRTFLDYYEELLSSLNFENINIESIEITNNVVVKFTKDGKQYSSSLPFMVKG